MDNLGSTSVHLNTDKLMKQLKCYTNIRISATAGRKWDPPPSPKVDRFGGHFECHLKAGYPLQNCKSVLKIAQ